MITRSATITNKKSFQQDLDKSQISYNLGEKRFDFAFKMKFDMPPEIGRFNLTQIVYKLNKTTLGKNFQQIY